MSILCKFGCCYDITPPYLFQCKKINVQQRATHNCNKLITDTILWIGKFDPQRTERILTDFLTKNKTRTSRMFGLKRFKLNVQDSSQLQNILRLNNHQMRVLQRFVKQKTHSMLLSNEHELLDYQQFNALISAVVMEMDLLVCSRFVNSMAQMPVQSLPVYLADLRDAISRIFTATLNQGCMFVGRLNKHKQVTVEIGCDKSDAGIQESCSLNIRRRHHGKNNSIVTVLTDPKVDENYINYIEIAKLHNRRSIINGLMLFPNLIIIGQIKYNHQQILQHAHFAVYPMLYDPKSQQLVNQMYRNQIRNIDAPNVLFISIDPQLLPQPIKRDITQTTTKPATPAINNNNINEDITVTTCKNVDNENDNDVLMQVPSNANSTITTNTNTNTDGVLFHVMEIEETPVQKQETQLNKSKCNDNKKLPAVKTLVSNKKSIEIDPATVTDSFWCHKQTLIHLPRLYCVKLPDDFKLDFPDNNTQHKQVLQKQVDTWMKMIVQGKTKIWNQIHKQSATNSSSNTNKTNNVQTSRSVSTSNSCITDFFHHESVSKQRNRDSDNGSIYDPTTDLHQLTQDQEENEWERVNQQQHHQNNNYITLQLYNLEDFHFNKNSRLNRMQESHWFYQSNNISTQTTQSTNIFIIQYMNFAHHELNNSLSAINDTNAKIGLNLDSLFDDTQGISFFWIEYKFLPSDYNSSSNRVYTFGIVHNGAIYGLLNILIQSQSGGKHFHSVQCMILSRCLTFNDFSLTNCTLNTNNNDCYIEKNNNLDELFGIGSTKIDTTKNVDNLQLTWWSMDLNAVMQFDNKSRNIVCGMSTASAKFPCAICDASTNEIYSLPQPQTMSFATRTITTKSRDLQQGMNIQGKVNLRDSHGVQNASIFDIPAHKHAVATLHNFEGIFAITMDTFRDMICDERGHKKKWQDLQCQVKELQKKYEKIIQIEEILKQTEENSSINNSWQENRENELVKLKKQYLKDYSDWENIITKNDQNTVVFEFIHIMDKYNISLYYMLAGSVQGVMCGRIIKASADLIELVQKRVNQTAALLWKHLFMNLSYLYQMLKHNSNRLWTMHELATVKTAYIDWYHQHLMIVRLWRQKGSIGIKCHYLLHDIEKAIWYQGSVAAEDDQRFENVNQLIDDNVRVYSRYQGKDKLQLIARRMNCQCLNVTQKSQK